MRTSSTGRAESDNVGYDSGPGPPGFQGAPLKPIRTEMNAGYLTAFRRRFGAAIFAAIVVIVLGHTGPAAAAFPVEGDDGAVKSARYSASLLRIQQSLTKLGFYLGPEDGRMNRQTEAAIRIYQRANGIEPTGRVSRELADQLDYAIGVRRLLHQLDVARAESIKDARNKLLNHPATRDLIKPSGVDVADPTRDASQCFDKPTALCLLKEAVESAKAIGRAEMRDWALGEILIAQARAGLGEAAMQTAAKIRDPRLIIVALRDIAEAQAAGGQAASALEAAEIIPDPEKKSEALAAIAEIQIRRGDGADAKITVGRLLSGMGKITDQLKRIAFRARAAVIYARAGERKTAEEELTRAELAARDLPQDVNMSAGLRHVASALASIEEIKRALDMLNAVSQPSDRIPVLMSAAEAHARAGDAAAALATAETIENVRYRAVALGRIAVAHADAGRNADADATIEIALAAIDRIDRPYARSFAISRIALAMVRIAAATGPHAISDEARARSYKRAIDAVMRIEDQRLKAHTLWLIASSQRVREDSGWRSTEELAELATDEIIGALSRVWMFAELAEGHALDGENDAAWRSFSRGLSLAADIDNSWSRARTMAKLAATLIRLVDPGRGRSSEPN